MVVVSDHHMPPKELPPAHAITNPRLSEDNPCPHLAGVGVAFFLMAALNGKLEAMSGKRMDMRQVLDLVALGTLADMVSLTGQNRILVKNGLLKIAEAKRPASPSSRGPAAFPPWRPSARDRWSSTSPRASTPPGVWAAPRWPTTCCSHPRTTKPPNWPKR